MVHQNQQDEGFFITEEIRISLGMMPLPHIDEAQFTFLTKDTGHLLFDLRHVLFVLKESVQVIQVVLNTSFSSQGSISHFDLCPDQPMFGNLLSVGGMRPCVWTFGTMG